MSPSVNQLQKHILTASHISFPASKANPLSRLWSQIGTEESLHNINLGGGAHMTHKFFFSAFQ